MDRSIDDRCITVATASYGHLKPFALIGFTCRSDPLHQSKYVARSLGFEKPSFERDMGIIAVLVHTLNNFTARKIR